MVAGKQSKLRHMLDYWHHNAHRTCRIHLWFVNFYLYQYNATDKELSNLTEYERKPFFLAFFGACKAAFAPIVNAWFVGQSDEMVFLSSEKFFYGDCLDFFCKKIQTIAIKKFFA